MQSVYLAAQRKSQTLTESIEGFAVEGQKLTERLVSAEAQYLDGMRKTKAASKQLQSLAKEVHASEQAAHRKCSPLCTAACCQVCRHSTINKCGDVSNTFTLMIQPVRVDFLAQPTGCVTHG